MYVCGSRINETFLCEVRDNFEATLYVDRDRLLNSDTSFFKRREFKPRSSRDISDDLL